jgi:hypothetical protein
MHGPLIDVDAWIAWLEALRQVSAVVVPVVMAFIVIYLIASTAGRWRWRG